MRSLQQLRTQSHPTRYCAGFTRTVSPEQTYDRLVDKLDRFGIVRVADVTGLDRIGLPVVIVCRPNGRSVCVSGGKGLTLAAAQVSGVMEAIELHHAERINAPLLFASASKMGERHRVVDLAKLATVRDRQAHADHRMLWLEGFDLITGHPTWVPYETVSLNASAPVTPGGELFASTANGLASGNHVMEAVLHGLCEVIERDAISSWYASSHDKRARTRLDLDSVDHSDCRNVLTRLAAANIEVLVWDMTSNVKVPAFMCLIVDSSGDEPNLYCSSTGFGCHPSRGMALLRALTEAAQSRLTLISGVRDEVFREESAPVAAAEIEAYRALTPTHAPLRQFNESVLLEFDSLDGDLVAVLDALLHVGINSVIAVELTDPNWGIPVVRIIVPGLEGPTPCKHPRAPSSPDTDSDSDSDSDDSLTQLDVEWDAMMQGLLQERRPA